MSIDTLTPELRELMRVVTPSPTPSEDEIAAWRNLPRDEQLSRMRLALASRDASTPCGAQMSDIWAEIEADTQTDG